MTMAMTITILMTISAIIRSRTMIIMKMTFHLHQDTIVLIKKRNLNLIIENKRMNLLAVKKIKTVVMIQQMKRLRSKFQNLVTLWETERYQMMKMKTLIMIKSLSFMENKWTKLLDIQSIKLANIYLCMTVIKRN
ncbi:hypothetical protein GLOIN_2v1577173 [Rhizophagus irregularis DAOM 181602=DAOM 197198]|uniref:Uncharacterized protein n=1 Tax=Rhizophagus irregularis (strain DAOM 181602 / DAOM 197198 / MUCL 43194) TaxID=747089 RepID=A0A2P4Q9D7_RHIID|nr:hypothetical protein GLOIN_2v1577173 [Rhizophagus irregularis DAOM 181602=DAOM 197198]POG74251.1 hypothetical protein GLOIN_2v1577173 [Rhizophagus irregularis DAOM 181602=DAOM 197198]|eukprot:XP_025181117.1 hypothetical protein GLOIN_2v1577173 [Rhizophagus irregularis DAOM 181602=DAOM 197198]